MVYHDTYQERVFPMKTISTIASLILIAVTACTAAEVATAKTIVDVSGNVCQAVFASVDPSLDSVCTTGAAIAAAVEALVAQHSSADAALSVSKTPYAPTQAEIYAYLVAHGATAVKH